VVALPGVGHIDLEILFGGGENTGEGQNEREEEERRFEYCGISSFHIKI
jgi:hypothetical protein